MAVTLDVYGRSIAGSTHAYEDRLLVDEQRMLYAVADGVTMSSQGTGGAAAEVAVRLLKETFTGNISESIERVHENMLELKLRDRSIGETTLTAACIRSGSVELANVGDSPAYLIRGAKMQRLAHPDKDSLGYITQTVGYPEMVEVHLSRTPMREGDYFVLASDGVYHVLKEEIIVPLAQSHLVARDFVETVIDEAQGRVRGYDDDKSVIVVRIVHL